MKKIITIKIEIDTNHPIAFLSDSGCLFMRCPGKLSADRTPRYIPNPNSDATYCLEDCLNDYTPVWSVQLLKEYKEYAPLLQEISSCLRNLKRIDLENQLVILYQGLLEPLDFDFERIRWDWNEVEGDFFKWYGKLLPVERKRLLEYEWNFKY